MQILDGDHNQPVLNMDDLKKCLRVENEFLTKLVDRIPAKMYFEHDIQEKITAEKHLSMNKVAEAIKRKSNNHIELSAKGKHKRARLDPFNQKSVSQIHSEFNKKKQKKKKMKGVNDPSASIKRAANIEELQKRLQERIDILQAKRKAARSHPDALRKLKTKVKKLNRKKGNMLKAQELNKPSDNHIDKPSEKKKNDKSSEKPVFNKEGNFIYSKFDFTGNGMEDTKKDEYAGKKTKALLKKAEKKQERLQKLKTTDPEKAELVSEKDKWKKAIQKTEGLKVRDDPKLLKKSLKREEKKKKKSTKAWKGRVEETEKRKQARQDKRNRNIKQRKKEKLDHKVKIAKKKGRVISGF